MLIYITCPATAATLGLPLGFNNLSDSTGESLVNRKNAYDMNYPRPFPVFGYCDPDAVPADPPPPAPPPPAPPPPPPPPPPAPAPQSVGFVLGPEDQHIKIDTDGDGKTDVHVIVDNPPQNAG